MKLSQLPTDRASDALIVIAAEIQPILLDPILISQLKNNPDDSQLSLNSALLKITALIPDFLGKYRRNLFRILAALNNSSSEAIANQNLLVTLSQIRELLNDDDLINFFSPSSPQDPPALSVS